MRNLTYHLVLTALALGLLAARAEDKSKMPCVEIQNGQDSASHMNCLNETLRRAAQHEHDTPLPQVPVTAGSASNKVGTFNDAAAAQMMGNAYGVSAQPQRPKTTFPTPLLRPPH